MPKVNQLGHATDALGILHPTHQSDEINDGQDIDVVPQPGRVDPHETVVTGGPEDDAETEGVERSAPVSSSVSSDTPTDSEKKTSDDGQKPARLTGRRFSK